MELIKTNYWIMAGLLTASVILSGCATHSSTKAKNLSPFAKISQLINGPSETETEEIRLKEDLQKLPITDPRRQDDLNRLWYKVAEMTEAMPLSDNRIHIKSKGGILFITEQKTEHNFFIRAAAETLRSGNDGFVIVHLDYYNAYPKPLSFVPQIQTSSRPWIGNYEDFRRNRSEQNMFSGGEGDGKRIDGVIMVLSDETYPNRERFSAEEIYLNYLTYRARQ